MVLFWFLFFFCIFQEFENFNRRPHPKSFHSIQQDNIDILMIFIFIQEIRMIINGRANFRTEFDAVADYSKAYVHNQCQRERKVFFFFFSFFFRSAILIENIKWQRGFIKSSICLRSLMDTKKEVQKEKRTNSINTSIT